MFVLCTPRQPGEVSRIKGATDLVRVVQALSLAHPNLLHTLQLLSLDSPVL